MKRIYIAAAGGYEVLGMSICAANGIEHRLTKPNHPWTSGQVERMNRTINARR